MCAVVATLIRPCQKKHSSCMLGALFVLVWNMKLNFIKLFIKFIWSEVFLLAIKIWYVPHVKLPKAKKHPTFPILSYVITAFLNLEIIMKYPGTVIVTYYAIPHHAPHVTHPTSYHALHTPVRLEDKGRKSSRWHVSWKTLCLNVPQIEPRLLPKTHKNTATSHPYCTCHILSSQQSTLNPMHLS
jgi:hypothetical protein